ncbi:MAG: hypothetical protein KAS70_07170 [Planctomycetes bacterium]|nr:hypothetical protein [Planctomycetota bacterium]
MTEKKKFTIGIAIFLGGLALYPIIHTMRLPDMMCMYLTVLIHELGHCIMYLLFGKIALPRLDFQYGGGMAIPIFDLGFFGYLLILGLLAYLAYQYRENIQVLSILIIIAVIYSILNFTRAHQVMIGGGGHFFEAIGAGICFYRCLIAGNALDFERPIYAVLGWWITLHGITFFWGLANNMYKRVDYLNDPARYNDLDRIANMMQWDFWYVAMFFCGLFFITLILTLILVAKKLMTKEVLP